MSPSVIEKVHKYYTNKNDKKTSEIIFKKIQNKIRFAFIRFLIISVDFFYDKNFHLPLQLKISVGPLKKVECSMLSNSRR